jgi:hypothetical protein
MIDQQCNVGMAYLRYVRVGMSKTPYNFYAIAIQIELWQAVVLLRDPTITIMALTWKTRGTDRLKRFPQPVLPFAPKQHDQRQTTW